MGVSGPTFRDTIPGLDEMIMKRYISVREHPIAPLRIYNYTAKAQFDHEWNPATTTCRGLILDVDGNLVARPFRKFFNLGEHEGVPDGAYDVWEKVDGSLGVLYWHDGRPAIASRGSFLSDQALKGSAILEDRYAAAARKLDPAITYLFEIIYPDNRIVVDYGDREDLVLLAAIDTATGRTLPLPETGFPTAERVASGVSGDDPERWFTEKRPNAEGYVLHWPEADHRLKVKFDEYLTIHRLVCGLSQKKIWESLRDGRSRDLFEYAGRTTEGHRRWIDGIAGELYERHVTICQIVEEDAKLIPVGERREQAEWIKTRPYPSLLFAALDGHDYRAKAWGLVKPGRAWETYRKDGE